MTEETRTEIDHNTEVSEPVEMVEKGTEVSQYLKNELERLETALEGFEQVKRNTRIDYERKRGQIEGAEATVKTELLRVEKMLESLTSED